MGFLGKGSCGRGQESENAQSGAHGLLGTQGSLHLEAGSGGRERHWEVPESEALGGDLFVALFGQRAGAAPFGFGLMVPPGSPAVGGTFSVAPFSTFKGPLFLGSGFIW